MSLFFKCLFWSLNVLLGLAGLGYAEAEETSVPQDLGIVSISKNSEIEKIFHENCPGNSSHFLEVRKVSQNGDLEVSAFDDCSFTLSLGSDGSHSPNGE